MENQKILSVNNLFIEFQTSEGIVHAVNDLSYELYAGDTLGIVGESGSGKSVSSLASMGLIPSPPGKISGGNIVYMDQDLTALTDKQMEKIRGNQISMIFQEPMTSLNPILTCGEQIAEVLMLHKSQKKKMAMQNAVQLMKSVGIANAEERVKQYPHQMSGGMKQRVMIAMALACMPKILIADEPTTALDVTIQAQILDLMKQLNQENHTAIILITHDLGVVSELCERVLVMYTGHIVEEALTADVLKNPLHPYTIGLINAIPKITKEKTRLSIIDGVVPNPTEECKGCSFNPRCSKAMDICRTSEPPMVQIDETRKVRCWLYNKNSEEKR